MSLKQMASALRKRWRVVVGAIVVAAALGVAYVSTANRSYDATAQLYVSAAGNSTALQANSYVDQLGVQQRMTSYVQIAHTQSVLRPVADTLGLPYDWQTLKSKVSVSNPANTTLLTVSASDGNAAKASDIANAVSFQLVSYITTLETTNKSSALVKATLVQPAATPAHPSSPQPVTDMAAALLLGAAVGIASALAREALDTSVKTVEDLEQAFGVIGLGSIPFDRRTRKRPVLAAGTRRSSRAEAFRQLRTNLQFVQIDQQPRSILFTSAVKGEGKTATACNLAVMLAQIGVKVILLDADLRRPRVAEFMKVSPAVGLTSVLMGWADWREALQPWGDEGLNLRVMAAAELPPNPAEMIASERMHTLLGQLEADCDVVIIDGPPLLPVADSALLAASASGTVLVVRCGETRRADVAKALSALDSVDARLYGVVLNMAQRGAGESDYYAYRRADAKALNRAIAAAGANGSGVNGTKTTSLRRHSRVPEGSARRDRRDA